MPSRNEPHHGSSPPALLFAETRGQRLRRWTLGVAYALRPNRVRFAPRLLALTAGWLATGRRPLPSAADAHDRCNGLCGLVHDLSPDTLLEAYARGLYPFCHLGPLKWWAPPERTVLFFPELHIAKRLRRQIRNGGYRVTFDEAFPQVVRACAGPRTGKVPLTWITPRIMAAYTAAHAAGHAHSFEVWNPAGELVGGGYGLSFGRIFSTESQFSTEPNTSKIAFTALNWHLARWGYVLNDGKHFTPTIDGMGFRPIDRAEFTALCEIHGRPPHRAGRWSAEADLATVSTWQPEAG